MKFKRRVLKDGDKIPFTAITKDYGRADSVCALSIKGESSESFISTLSNSRKPKNILFMNLATRQLIGVYRVGCINALITLMCGLITGARSTSVQDSASMCPVRLNILKYTHCQTFQSTLVEINPSPLPGTRTSYLPTGTDERV